MSPDDIRQSIELQVVEFLKEKATEGTMTEERSQQIAQRVLDMLQPGMSLEELFRKIPLLDDTCPEISFIIVPYLRQYEDRIAQRGHQAVSNLIKQGQYESAVNVAKKVVGQDVKLVWTGEASSSSAREGKSSSSK